MKSRFAAVVAVLLVLSTALVVMTAAESEAADKTVSAYQIAGYVVDDRASGNTALEGVSVIITDSGTSYRTATNADGYFVLSVSSPDKLTVQFAYAGYTVRSCPCGTVLSDGTISLDLSGITPTAVTVENVTTYTYTFTSASAGLQPVIMSSTVGVVVVTVSDSTETAGVISEATVTLVSATNSSIRYSGVTDSSGRYTFSNVITGYYYLTASSNGYDNSVSQTVSVTNGYTYLTATMAQKPTDIYLGLSLGHLLMLIGILLGIILILFSWLLYRHGRTPVDVSDLDRSQHEIQKEEEQAEKPVSEDEPFRPGSGSA